MTGQEAVSEAMRQMVDGLDYTPIERLIADLVPEDACRKPAGGPYSIATIAWHTWFWVNAWVVAIDASGDPFQGLDPDASWPEVAPSEWPGLRERLRESLKAATALCSGQDLDRITYQDRTVGGNLLQIAVHTAYHIGQITLIRLELGLWPPAGGD